MRLLSGILFVLFFIVSPSLAAEIRLSVAASMANALKELITAYQQQAPAVEFLPNFASSGSLAKQIDQGAPADLFISANPEWMAFLVERDRVPADQVRTFAYNALVFSGKQGTGIQDLADLTKLQRIALGSPKSVPAGQYAEQALRAAGLWEQLQGKLVMAQDVRQALLYADRGEADGAFVYRTDAMLAKQALILLEVPQKLYSAITYPVGLTGDGARKPAAVAFFDFLKTSAAAAILQKHGFVVR
jgi:molybdate transport system substrate-binding protein